MTDSKHDQIPQQPAPLSQPVPPPPAQPAQPVSAGNQVPQRVIHVTTDTDSDSSKHHASRRSTRKTADSSVSVSTMAHGSTNTGAHDPTNTGSANGAAATDSASAAPVPDLLNASGTATIHDGDAVVTSADPLLKHPRKTSIVLCVVLALVYFAAAAGVYWAGVRTRDGQNFDDMVWEGLKSNVPGWLVAVSSLLSHETTIPIISVALAILAFIIMAVRKRWALMVQGFVFGVVCYGLAWLKRILPRPMLVHISSQHANSAPSGHTMLAVGASVVLLFAVPRVWRAVVAVIGCTYSSFVAVSLIIDRWHRPSDVVMSLLLVTGLALLASAFTWGSGMDDPGKRVSSASIQIVSSVMITFGALLSVYGMFVLWNILPGLDIAAMWTNSGAYSSTLICIAGLNILSFGLLLAMRHLTASPLSKIGLIGAPPAPPEE